LKVKVILERLKELYKKKLANPDKKTKKYLDKGIKLKGLK